MTPIHEAPRTSAGVRAAPAGDRLPSRLVVGYDGSAGASAAAAFGLWLAGGAGARATVVHAVPAPQPLRAAGLLPPDAEPPPAHEREWGRRLERLCAAAPEGAAVDGRVVRGSPAGVLVSAAVESRADLVLIGSRGAGRIRGALLGSVSSQVLAHAPCSVMVFPDRARSAPAAEARSIVVGVDGSPSAGRALELAQALAGPLGARLVLVHAYDPHIPFAVMTTEGIRDLLRRHGHDVLAAARAGLAEPQDAVIELTEGHSRDALVAAAERHAPALLAVGSRGLGAFRELMLGSTSHWVAGHAPCPVLIARSPLAP